VVRIARAQLRKDLAAGSVCIESVLADPPACARTAKVRDLLMSLQRFGPVRVARVLAKCRVSESKTLEGLSERQRAALLDHFRAT
jgi:hypothetical protein